jgi:hypothetical protein
LEEDQSKAKWKARPLKDAEDFCLSLLWHRFGIAVLLSGSVTGIDAANGLCCLTVDGRSDQWCRFRERLANKLPDIGARVEVFGWEKWNARIVEVMELTTR